ncbi:MULTISPECIES: 3H domain-containing protein [Methanobacterium]|uniref:NAD-binding protein n=1 Tax=Methanobacterium veterum TaxID=408577 RepID=A0A9E4ZZ48_9EURY|nr:MULTISPECIES: 3H domain-containing protein [Methanobacterium]MCZ3366107.1 NAD-binding protein [Methanobacterium veterum]MCZ3371665.1 NAD-binding protein [Methanobacterium veterum]
MPIISYSILIYALVALMALFIYGIIGSMYIMHLDIINSLYYTVITIATVGYGDIIPVTPVQKLFTITLVLGGVGLVAYVFTLALTVISMAVEEVTSGSRQRRRIAAAKNHFILCGYGRVGSAVFKQLQRRNQEAIIIERNRNIIEKELWEEPEVLAIPGDATDEDILKSAGIKKARGIIIATGEDVDNLFITLTARELHPEIWIVARASKSENIKRLYRSGADKVISPETSGGEDIYFAAIQPTLVKITMMHGVSNIKKEAEIILRYGATLENIEYHLPEFKEPLARKIEISKMDELNKFMDSLERDPARKNSLQRVYESVSGIHSHWISGQDRESLDRIVEELKKEGLLLGVNLNDDEIKEAARKHGRIVEVIVKPEIKITESHAVGDIRKEAEIILKHGCTMEDIEYYLTGFHESLHRNIGLSRIEDMDNFLKSLDEDSKKMESLERLYSLSGGGIHSHKITGPDTKSLANVEKELKAKGFLLGVNLSKEEIETKIQEFGRVVELLLRHEVTNLDDKKIIVGLKGRILDSKHYLPGVRQIVTRNLYVSSEKDVKNCEDELKRPDARRSVESLYKISRQIHSHTVAAPDVKTIKKIEKALDNKGILLGVNLPEEKIWEIVESQPDDNE